MNTLASHFDVDTDHGSEDETTYNILSNIRDNKRLRKRLRIVRDDGSYYSFPYDDIHTIEGTPDGKYLTLIIRGGRLVTLEGERLKTLADYLDDYKICKLYLYNPRIHTLKDKKTPVITSIMEEVIGKVRQGEKIDPITKLVKD